LKGDKTHKPAGMNFDFLPHLTNLTKLHFSIAEFPIHSIKKALKTLKFLRKITAIYWIKFSNHPSNKEHVIQVMIILKKITKLAAYFYINSQNHLKSPSMDFDECVNVLKNFELEYSGREGQQ
jgi:hypothetical protein